MRDEPTAANLIETARAMLRDRLLPRLPADARYEALMVANAMAIAARQIAAGDRPLVEARARLGAIYAAPDATNDELVRRFAGDVRAGAFDAPGERRTQVFEHLWRTALAAVAESNPKALDRPAP